jgi:deoxyribonucleoside regulator
LSLVNGHAFCKIYLRKRSKRCGAYVLFDGRYAGSGLIGLHPYVTGFPGQQAAGGELSLADIVGVSRVSVSRLLSTARDKGIVRISIVDPRVVLENLERRLEQLYGLKKAVVVSGSVDDDVVKQRIGRAGAQLLESCVRDGDTIGIGRGTTVYQTVNHLSGKVPLPSSCIVPLAGSAGLFDSYFQVNEMARHTAETFGAQCVYLNVPYYVSSMEVKQALLKEKLVADCVRRWGSLDIALVGIGGASMSRDPAFLARVGSAEAGTGKKVAADLCGRFIGCEGESLEGERDLLIAVSLEHLRKANTVIGVCGGKTKAPAILAALKGKHLDMLVTDEVSAEMLCSACEK